MEIRTILTPAEIAALPASDLRGSVCVVFDVLRATSTLLAALTNGASRVFPVLTVEEAFALRGERLPGALLGGERDGIRIDGFDLGNSPREYLREAVGGRDIITTTTNGTVALRACTGADAVVAAALVNVEATAVWLASGPVRAAKLLLVCAGTGREFALEDGLAAGALAARFPGAEPDDATRAMLTLHARHREDVAGALRASKNGQRLAQIGLGEDMAWCARESVLAEVAVWRDGAMQDARRPLSTASSDPKLEPSTDDENAVGF